MGKELWEDIDVDKYIEEERNSWDRLEPEHNVTEFRGFAKELWEGLDVEKYINEERNSWES